MTTKRILIFNVNWLGDVLFSSATIRNIRRNFPDSFISCIIPSRCYAVLKDNPNLDEIIIFDERDRHKSIYAKARFVQLLKSKKFDKVFLLHRSFSRALIAWLAGIRERVGYYTKKRWFLLTKKITALPVNSVHRIDYYLNIIEKAGLRVEDRYTEFFTSDEDKKAVDDFFFKKSINRNSFLVGINPAGNWLPKRWPKESWAALSDKLISRFNAKVIITGGAKDLLLAGQVQSLMKEKPVIVCDFNLKQSAELFKRLDLFITADTGPLHIANSVGTKKIIALFGPTHPQITGPYPDKNVIIISKDVGCKIPCYAVNCKNNWCMKAITVEDVIEKIELVKA